MFESYVSCKQIGESLDTSGFCWLEKKEVSNGWESLKWTQHLNVSSL